MSKSLRGVLGLMSAVAFAAVFMLGCGGDKGVNSKENGGNGNGSLDTRLVSGTGEAWVDDYSVGNRDGFILHSNGTYVAIDDDNGTWNQSGTGTWTTNNNVLTLTGSGHHGGWSGPYSLSGNTLTFYVETFNKLTGVTIGGSVGGGNGTGNGTGDNSGILGAWSDNYGECHNDGYLFRPNNTVAFISDYDCYWEIDFEGTYTISGNTLTICALGMCFSGPFTVSGNNLDFCDSDGDCERLIRVTTGLSKAQKAAKSMSVPVGDRAEKTRPFAALRK
jgi:hypothetical protein